jgi:hypothetical protein
MKFNEFINFIQQTIVALRRIAVGLAKFFPAISGAVPKLIKNPLNYIAI